MGSIFGGLLSRFPSKQMDLKKKKMKRNFGTGRNVGIFIPETLNWGYFCCEWGVFPDCSRVLVPKAYLHTKWMFSTMFLGF